jgi:hypothetical protein
MWYTCGSGCWQASVALSSTECFAGVGSTDKLNWLSSEIYTHEPRFALQHENLFTKHSQQVGMHYCTALYPYIKNEVFILCTALHIYMILLE